MNVMLRTARPDDAERCGVVCYEAFRAIAGRHNFPPDFPDASTAVALMGALLTLPDVYAVVAERGGRIVASNFLWQGSTIAAVGPITVDPTVQDGGIGRLLMEHVLQRAREHAHAGVRLVQAAYHSRSLSLYTKLGFVAREPLVALQGPPVQAEIRGRIVRAATAADVAACARLCHRVHGYERTGELRTALAQGTATVVEHDDRVSGYATTVGFFGHAVGESNEDLKALIGAAPSFAGPGFLLPTRNAELLRWCLERRLRVVQPMTLMSVGLYNEPGGAFLPSVLC